MSALDLFRRSRKQHASRPAEHIARVPLAPGMPGVTDTALYVPVEDTGPAPAYRPHGIDTPEVLAAIRAQAYADALAAQETAGPVMGRVPVPPPRPVPPPPMPCSGVSAIWVGQITYPDPSDLSYDKGRHYRETLRHIGKATGTYGSLEDTGMWPVPALETEKRPA